MTEISIRVDHLTKRFGTVTAVNEVSFEIERGATYALLGANGAGKTTTLAMLLGLLLPSSGSIRILDVDMLRERYRVLHRMNYSSPYVDLPQRLTVQENLTVYARLYGVKPVRPRLARLFEELEIGDFAKRRYRSLSAGQRTRVSLAKALLNEPDILLMDEPTASLDPDSADRLRTYLENYQHRSGATILLASHNMPEVERLCDHVLMMRRGRIVDAGAPEQLVARYGRQNMEQVFLDVARRQEAAA